MSRHTCPRCNKSVLDGAHTCFPKSYPSASPPIQNFETREDAFLPVPSPVEAAPTTGPKAWLNRVVLPRLDKLLSLDHNPARQASEEYDEAFHEAVHALKTLRQFADSLSPTWAAPVPVETPDDRIARRYAELEHRAPAVPEIGELSETLIMAVRNDWVDSDISRADVRIAANAINRAFSRLVEERDAAQKIVMEAEELPDVLTNEEMEHVHRNWRPVALCQMCRDIIAKLDAWALRRSTTPGD